MAGFVLPEAPAELAGKAVRAWSAPVVIPTYEPMPADKNPMFLEKRVYQGSSGKVYPLPFVDRISTEKKDRAWQAIHIENEYVRLMILPELGGRIHVGLDKTNGYDFFYRQNVIKPALVGLAGPWISGGVEFNWPQHHRPSTFMPVDTHIEEHQDGSVTVWCSEHEPMTRMKGMHGVHLRPGSSLIELKVRLYNRTELPQTFLWWANVAARVHEQYQSFFPPDVQYVADHAKRAMARFPLCEGKYYGVDYGERSKKQETGSQQQWDEGTKVAFPPGNYPRNDLSWYANIPVPTSYMILGTKEDFFGGYDHHAQAGFVHVADHRIAPGKKQWTWGNHPFGYAWDRNLTDPDDPNDSAPPYRRDKPAPYIELMAGVFTDNQPDFSYLMPGETRTFSQFWYPIQKIGPVQKANLEGAISLALLANGTARIGATVTHPMEELRLELRAGDRMLFETGPENGKGIRLAPDAPFFSLSNIPADVSPEDLLLTLSVTKRSGPGIVKVACSPPVHNQPLMPEAAKEPLSAAEAESVEELYLIGLHLEQYRHATRMPEDYWREALRREPGDARCNNALGLWHLRRGEFGKAVACFQTAITTLTKYNPNPRDGEVYYNLGVAYRYLDEHAQADDAFFKASWNSQWQKPALEAQLSLTAVRRNWKSSQPLLHAAHKSPIDEMRAVPGQPFSKRLEVRFDFSLLNAQSGNFKGAIAVLSEKDVQYQPAHQILPAAASPMYHYYIAYFSEKLGESKEATQARAAAALAPPDYCFPHRLEEIAILQSAIDKKPDDPRAPYYLGNLLYDKRRHEEAIVLWEKAAKLDRSFPTVWRNLGIGYFNILHDAMAAKGAYQRAFKNSLAWGVAADQAAATASPGLPVERAILQVAALPEKAQRPTEEGTTGDARIFYERDQLWKRTHEMPQARAGEMEKFPHLVRQRDDLTIEYCTLLNLLGRQAEALAILRSRRFQPWEGGEGLALGQWARAHLALGRKVLWLSPADGGSPREALEHFHAALQPPENLGETWHYLQNNSELHYWAGMAAQACGEAALARRHFETAADSVGDFQGMAVRTIQEATYWAGMALQELGRAPQAQRLFEAMLAHAQHLKTSPAKIDYFATSLPTMLLFEDDIQAVQGRQAMLMEALALHGLNGQGGKERKAARRLLNDLLAGDPAHGLAADLLVSLDWVM